MSSWVYVADGDQLTPVHYNGGINLGFDILKDLGICRAWAIETILEGNMSDCLFHYHDHYCRLVQSAKIVRIPFRVSLDALRRAVELRLRESRTLESLLLIRLSRGLTDDTVNPTDYFSNRSLVSISVYPGQRQSTSIRLETREYEREFAGVKHTNYLFAMLEYKDLSKKGISDILYLRRKTREVLECARKNVGIFLDGERLLFPPSDSVLPGITQKIVAKLARSDGIRAGVSADGFPISYDQLLKAHSVIAMSTTAVVPVEEIDGIKIPISNEVLRLCESFKEYREEYYRTNGTNAIRIEHDQD